MKEQFNEKLKNLEKLVIEMGSAVEKQVADAVEATIRGDVSLAKNVITDDKVIDNLEIAVDEAVFNILALHQPVAVDLRDIVGISKMNGDLERIGDHAQNIAESAITLTEKYPGTPISVIPKMCTVMRGMLKDAIDSFTQKNSDLAVSVCERDDEIDQLNKDLFSNILAEMIKNPAIIPASMEIIRISRNIERIADLCTNIAEDVIFIRIAKLIKHHRKNP